jgi:hypothetical protein
LMNGAVEVTAIPARIPTAGPPIAFTGKV